MHSKPTVTIAVSCYNEEANISNWMDSVLLQKAPNYHLTKIIVISDGSTDKTIQNIRRFKESPIEIWHFRKRRGKSYRLNQLYENLTTDLLIQSDADVTMAHPLVVSEMVKGLLSSKQVGMCGGNPTPLTAETITEKAINLTCEVFMQFRSQVRGGNNVFSADGRLLAYKRAFIKSVRIPVDMIANDAFTYFKALSLNYHYRFVKKAVVFFRSPQTITDQIRQNTRFVAAPIRLRKYFEPELVDREFKIPNAIFLRGVITQWVKHPILSSYIFLINTFCRVQAKAREQHLTALWEMASSTKQLAKIALLMNLEFSLNSFDP